MVATSAPKLDICRLKRETCNALAFPGTSLVQEVCKVLPLTSKERVKGLCNQGDPGAAGGGMEWDGGIFGSPWVWGEQDSFGALLCLGLCKREGVRWQEDMAGGHEVPESPLALAFCCWMLSLGQEGSLDFCEMAAVMGLGLGGALASAQEVLWRPICRQ